MRIRECVYVHIIFVIRWSDLDICLREMVGKGQERMRERRKRTRGI